MGDDGEEESPDKLVAEGVIMHVFFSNNSAASSNSLISALPHKNDCVSLDWQTQTSWNRVGVYYFGPIMMATVPRRNWLPDLLQYSERICPTYLIAPNEPTR
jgi:hypothetical protein